MPCPVLDEMALTRCVHSEPAVTAEAEPAPSAILGVSPGEGALLVLRDFPLHDLSLFVDRLGG